MKKAAALGVVVLLAACSEEPENPQETTLTPYINAWSSGDFEAMEAEIDADSIADIDWEFAERYETVYGDAGIEVETGSVTTPEYTEEEPPDYGEIDSITYEVETVFTTEAGDISVTTDVLVEQVEVAEEETEWQVIWEPAHFFYGMQQPNDRLAISREEPIRGEILDRNGEALAVNGEIYEAGIVPEAAEDVEESAEAFADVLGIDADDALARAEMYPDNPDWFAPIQTIALTDDRVDELTDIPGVLLNREDGRVYPYGAETGHLVGHIGPITGEELEETTGYQSESYIGKNGVELLLEEELRGQSGFRLAVTDEDGDVRDVIQEEAPVDGEDVTLTIDAELQADVYEILDEDSGAAVVLDPQNGDTLALVSTPAFDANLRYLQLPDPRADGLETTDVLFERRFQNAYSPGSIWKPFTAAIGLEEETLDPSATRTIEGEQWQADDSWGGYSITRVNDSETEVDLTTAMQLSDNIYFAQEALEIGADAMESWGETFGMDGGFSYDFPVHDAQLANEGLDTEILLADSGYGQGEVEISPVHITALYTAFVNDGTMIEPVLFGDGGETELFSPETAAVVHDSLEAVTQEEEGTAYRSGWARDVAGKTGTAELKSDQTVEDGEQIGWFTSYDDEYVATFMIQNAEDVGGSSYAVDLAESFWETIE
ncbi:penicillin-binding transpeptidase domain-containing protein [Bacillus daqingensis]|uniref:serine-type D-Ala-D-Ala carboxypeptidase n=1 Tax=Bacillus daqingensis TaxID=872396 RepID=A0ABV9NTQ3_9BACI